MYVNLVILFHNVVKTTHKEIKKGALWNFTQDFESIHPKINILRGFKNLTNYDILELWHHKS